MTLREQLRRFKYRSRYAVSDAIERAAGGRVISGPFQGMLILGHDPYLPYLLGTYEMEIHPILERLIATKFDFIIDIGAAEGYVLTGIGRRCPDARLLGFEMDQERCKNLIAVAEANGIGDRVELRGKCDIDNLRASLPFPDRTLLIVDVEGYELELLQPKLAPELQSATILVETHDAFVPGCARAIRERFAPSHRIESMMTRTRILADFPLADLRARANLNREILGAMDEGRPGPMEFLLLMPTSRAQI